MEPTIAKQFFVSKILDEAEFEHLHLSEIEKKMLHFTEAHRTLPDMAEVAAQFESQCDSDDYESKIISLLKAARARDEAHSSQQKETWDEALSALKHEDHYLLVMVYCAFPEYRKAILPTHRVRDYMIYIAIGITLVLLCVGVALWSH